MEFNYEKINRAEFYEADTLLNQGKPIRAFVCYKNKFEKLRKLFGVMTPNFIKIADNKFTEILEYVKRLFKVKEHALAQVVLTEAFSVSRSVSRMDPKLLSELLNLLSCCLRRCEQYDQSNNYLSRALRIEKLRGLSSASTLINMSANYFHMEKISKAIQVIKRALKELEKQRERNCTEEVVRMTGIAYFNYASQVRASGKRIMARDVSREAVKLLSELNFNKKSKIFKNLQQMAKLHTIRHHQSHKSLLASRFNHQKSAKRASSAKRGQNEVKRQIERNRSFHVSKNRLRSRSRISEYPSRAHLYTSNPEMLPNAQKSQFSSESGITAKITKNGLWRGMKKMEGWVTGRSDLRSGVHLYYRYCMNEITKKKNLYICDQYSHKTDKVVRDDRVTIGRVIQQGPRFNMYTEVHPRWTRTKKKNILTSTKNYVQNPDGMLFGGPKASFRISSASGKVNAGGMEGREVGKMGGGGNALFFDSGVGEGVGGGQGVEEGSLDVDGRQGGAGRRVQSANPRENVFYENEAISRSEAKNGALRVEDCEKDLLDESWAEDFQEKRDGEPENGRSSGIEAETRREFVDQINGLQGTESREQDGYYTQESQENHQNTQKSESSENIENRQNEERNNPTDQSQPKDTKEDQKEYIKRLQTQDRLRKLEEIKRRRNELKNSEKKQKRGISGQNGNNQQLYLPMEDTHTRKHRRARSTFDKEEQNPPKSPEIVSASAQKLPGPNQLNTLIPRTEMSYDGPDELDGGDPSPRFEHPTHPASIDSQNGQRTPPYYPHSQESRNPTDDGQSNQVEAEEQPERVATSSSGLNHPKSQKSHKYVISEEDMIIEEVPLESSKESTPERTEEVYSGTQTPETAQNEPERGEKVRDYRGAFEAENEDLEGKKELLKKQSFRVGFVSLGDVDKLPQKKVETPEESEELKLPFEEKEESEELRLPFEETEDLKMPAEGTQELRLPTDHPENPLNPPKKLKNENFGFDQKPEKMSPEANGGVGSGPLGPFGSSSKPNFKIDRKKMFKGDKKVRQVTRKFGIKKPKSRRISDHRGSMDPSGPSKHVSGSSGDVFEASYGNSGINDFEDKSRAQGWNEVDKESKMVSGVAISIEEQNIVDRNAGFAPKNSSTIYNDFSVSSITEDNVSLRNNLTLSKKVSIGAQTPQLSKIGKKSMQPTDPKICQKMQNLADFGTIEHLKRQSTVIQGSNPQISRNKFRRFMKRSQTVMHFEEDRTDTVGYSLLRNYDRTGVFNFIDAKNLKTQTIENSGILTKNSDLDAELGYSEHREPSDDQESDEEAQNRPEEEVGDFALPELSESEEATKSPMAQRTWIGEGDDKKLVWSRAGTVFESREELLRAVEEERELNEEINIDLHFIPRKLKAWMRMRIRVRKWRIRNKRKYSKKIKIFNENCFLTIYESLDNPDQTAPSNSSNHPSGDTSYLYIELISLEISEKPKKIQLSPKKSKEFKNRETELLRHITYNERARDIQFNDLPGLPNNLNQILENWNRVVDSGSKQPALVSRRSLGSTKTIKVHLKSGYRPYRLERSMTLKMAKKPRKRQLNSLFVVEQAIEEDEPDGGQFGGFGAKEGPKLDVSCKTENVSYKEICGRDGSSTANGGTPQSIKVISDGEESKNGEKLGEGDFGENGKNMQKMVKAMVAGDGEGGEEVPDSPVCSSTRRFISLRCIKRSGAKTSKFGQKRQPHSRDGLGGSRKSIFAENQPKNKKNEDFSKSKNFEISEKISEKNTLDQALVGLGDSQEHPSDSESSNIPEKSPKFVIKPKMVKDKNFDFQSKMSLLIDSSDGSSFEIDTDFEDSPLQDLAGLIRSQLGTPNPKTRIVPKRRRMAPRRSWMPGQ